MIQAQGSWTSGSDSGVLSEGGVLPRYILIIMLCGLAAAAAGSNVGGGVTPPIYSYYRLCRLAAATARSNMRGVYSPDIRRQTRTPQISQKKRGYLGDICRFIKRRLYELAAVTVWSNVRVRYSLNIFLL